MRGWSKSLRKRSKILGGNNGSSRAISLQGRFGCFDIGRSSNAIIGPSRADYTISQTVQWHIRLCLTLDVRLNTPSVSVQCARMASPSDTRNFGTLPFVSARTSPADRPQKPLLTTSSAVSDTREVVRENER